MTSPLLNDRQIAKLQRAKLRALNIPGIGIGGASWVIETASGDGEATAVTIGTGATITGYLYQERVTQASATQPGVQVGDTVLLFTVTDGSVAVGQVVRSADDGRRVRLQAQRPDPFYPLYVVEAQ